MQNADANPTGECIEDFKPIDIRYTCHDGKLYYPFQARVRHTGHDGVTTQQAETRVLCSDRSILTVTFPPTHNDGKGTKVCLLSDGTLIDRPPAANPCATWSVPSIMAFSEGLETPRPLPELLDAVLAYLKSEVWLPREEDYWLLALVVLVTYGQAIFNAVPLLHACGPAGSGKSHLGAAMARICANAWVYGEGSAQAIMRCLDANRGFSLFDDLEAVRAAKRGGMKFTDFIQLFKISYCKETAMKVVTDMREMRNQTLNLFGVKMINNTAGADPILASRMFRIQTCHAPAGLELPACDLDLQGLRDDLHTWVFCNADAIAAVYAPLDAATKNRAAQIAAPARAFARLAGAPWPTRLERALSRQAEASAAVEGPASLIRTAVHNLAARGYRRVSILQIEMEARAIGAEHGLSAEMLAGLNPTWVGRLVRQMDLVALLAPEERRRIGKVHTRIVTLRDNRPNGFHPIACGTTNGIGANGANGNGANGNHANGANGAAAPQNPVAFCTRACDNCRYRAADCRIMANLRKKPKR